MAGNSRPLSAIQNTTLATVTFHTWEYGVIEQTFVDSPSSTLGSVYDVTTTKSIDGSPGTFRLLLKPEFVAGIRKGRAISEFVQEGDWVEITVTKNGVKTYGMLGRVDLTSEQVAIGGQGAAVAVLTVTGRDFSFALADLPIYFNPWDSQWDNFAGVNMFRIIGDGLSGSPNDLIRSIIEGVFSAGATANGHLKVPPTLAGAVANYGDLFWIDLIDFSSAFQSKLRGEVVAPNALASEGANSVLSFIRSWMNPVLNEFWLDTSTKPKTAGFQDGKVVFREKPFVNTAQGLSSSWYSLPRHFVDARYLQAVDVTRGPGRKNHVWVLGEIAAGLQQDVYGFYKPLYNQKSIERHGLRRLEERSTYTAVTANDFTKESAKWVRLVRDWNALNHRHYNGTLTIGHLRPEISVGEKVLVRNGPIGGLASVFPSDNGTEADTNNMLSFYVEGVTHRISSGPNPTATTTLQVTRGYQEGKRLTDLQREILDWASAEELVEEAVENANTGDLGVTSQLDLKTLLSEPTSGEVV